VSLVSNATQDIDIVMNVERLKFANGRQVVLTPWTTSTPITDIPNFNKWQGLSQKSTSKPFEPLTSPSNAFMELVLGTPHLTWNKGKIIGVSASDRVEALLSEKKTLIDPHVIDGWNMGGIVDAQAIRPAMAQLAKIFSLAGATIADLDGTEAPDILKNIGTNGQLNTGGLFFPRLVDGTQAISNHSWGTAIDVSVDGILDYVADGKVQLAIAELTPLFNQAGWFAGSGYKNGRQDDMHFEMSKELLEAIFKVKYGTAGRDTISGSAKDEVFVGRNGNDSLAGKGGVDTFQPGDGNDTMSGGAGIDYFIFDQAPSSRNIDVITDLAHGVDQINLNVKVFVGIGKKGQDLSAGAFFSQSNAAQANDASDRIIYDPASGRLFYDRDGNKTKYDAVHFATLSNRPSAVDADDFFLV
jgi:hypothetical protein